MRKKIFASMNMTACVYIHISIVKCLLFGQKRSIDRLTSGPQIKHSFLCAMFASQTVWHLPYSFPLLFLSQCAFRQRVVRSLSIFASKAAARGELFCHQLISSNMTSRCNKHFCSNFPLNVSNLSSFHSKYLRIHCVKIIFIARIFV